MVGILSTMVLLPIAGALLVFLVSRINEKAAKALALLISVTTLVLALWAFATFQTRTHRISDGRDFSLGAIIRPDICARNRRNKPAPADNLNAVDDALYSGFMARDQVRHRPVLCASSTVRRIDNWSLHLAQSDSLLRHSGS